MKQFLHEADFYIRFQPFQLYPELPRKDPNGVDKEKFFDELTEQRHPGADKERVKQGFRGLQDAWKKDGLKLEDRAGSLGNSFDAQRLISLSRKQGREDAMIEQIYTANHENNLCLSNMHVLLACAEKAGVTGAKEMLDSNQEVDDVLSQIEKFRAAGINSVPVLLFNEKFPIHGAPEGDIINKAFKGLIEKGDAIEWPPKADPLPPPKIEPRRFVAEALAFIDAAKDEDLQKMCKITQNLDWSLDDIRWLILKEHILKGKGVRDTMGSAMGEVQALLRSEVNPRWDDAMRKYKERSK